MVKIKIALLTICILGVLFMSVSCKKSDSLNSPNETTGSYCFDLQSLKDVAIYNSDVIVNAEAAKQYASIIFKETLRKNINDYKKVTVMFDSNKNIWIVQYNIDDDTVGGDISIAISKKNGEVIKIWFGE